MLRLPTNLTIIATIIAMQNDAAPNNGCWKKKWFVFHQMYVSKRREFELHTIALFGLNGQWNVFRIWAAKGNTWCNPVKFVNKLQIKKIIIGLMQLALNKALNLYIRFDGGCVQLVSMSRHSVHVFANLRYDCSSSNSFRTACSVVQPRSQQSDFSASLSRFLDNSHTGVSGIYSKEFYYYLIFPS